MGFAVGTGGHAPAALTDSFALRFEAFDLDTRYQREVNAYVLSEASALRLAHRDAGQAGVRFVLAVQTRFEVAAFPRNHWRPATLRALAAHDGFTGGGFAAALPMPQAMPDDLAG